MNKIGKIYVVGIGPGDKKHMTIAARDAINDSDVIIGYKTYIKLIEDLIGDKTIGSSGMRKEIDRCVEALKYAEEGNIVSIISSGDAGVYGMAGIMHEIKIKENSEIDIEVIPGVTSANSSASCLGAPLMHDYVTISMSDLLTDWGLIEKRLHCAGEGDFVVAIYNPKSKGRTKQIEIAREILLKYKSKDTPVGIVRNAKRKEEKYVITTLENMLNEEIDMLTTVIVGNTNTYIKDNRMITPRGYKI